MRINAIVEPMKYNGQREYNNNSVYNLAKRNNNDEKESFSKIFDRVKGNIKKNS